MASHRRKRSPARPVSVATLERRAPDLVERAASGQEIPISVEGEVIARLVPATKVGRFALTDDMLRAVGITPAEFERLFDDVRATKPRRRGA